MAAFSVEDFDQRLNGGDCPSHVRTIVGNLRAHIASCGPVNWRAHRSLSGWGLRASAGGRIVCRIDPKPVGGYVGVQVMDAEPDEQALAGSVFLRKNAPSWVHVASSAEAAALYPLISRAYATAQARATRTRATNPVQELPADSAPALQPAPKIQAAPPPPAVSHTSPAEASDVRRVLEALGFRPVGAIRPIGDGESCVCDVEDVRGFLVYAQVVGPTVMKIGTTTPSLRSRMSQNAATINQVIALANGTATPAEWHSKPFDRFKQLAPAIIRSGRDIGVWVLVSSEHSYRAVERDLNARFATIEKGWTTRLW